MSEPISVAMPDGVTIALPDNLSVITTYVLLEQHDWFEDEIRFLRALIKPGMRALDVGANFGVYTLALAKAVGSTGRVWAIEPGSEAVEHLTKSLGANKFSHVELIQCALSRADGSGFMQTDVSPELRRLVAGGGAASVKVRSLDSLARERGIERIDFVKIDVEGEESNVLAGATEFLARESPLMMLEFAADGKLNEDIFEPLQRAGCATYRLVPGLNLLAPFYESEEPDAYQLNLFACNEQRAASLANENRLVASPATKPPALKETALDRLLALPFARGRTSDWLSHIERSRSGSVSARYLEALRRYYAAHDDANSATARLWALEQSYLSLRELVNAEFTPARAASFVRVAAEYGQRGEAVTACERLVKSLAGNTQIPLDEPLLAPWGFHESIDPGAQFNAWLLSSAVEAFEHLFQFSSGYKTQLAEEALNVRVERRFLSPSYLRREEVFNRRRVMTAGQR